MLVKTTSGKLVEVEATIFTRTIAGEEFKFGTHMWNGEVVISHFDSGYRICKGTEGEVDKLIDRAGEARFAASLRAASYTIMKINVVQVGRKKFVLRDDYGYEIPQSFFSEAAAIDYVETGQKYLSDFYSEKYGRKFKVEVRKVLTDTKS